MSELTKEKIYRNELEKVGGEGNNNLERIRSLGPYATVEYVNTLMSGALKRAIVAELPTEDIDTNTIYMVLDATAAQGNVYNEYLYIEEAWELIGTTAMEMPHLYEHYIWINSTFSDSKYVLCSIITTFSTPFTVSTFLQWLFQQNHKTGSTALFANGTDNILGIYTETGEALFETKGTTLTNLGPASYLSLVDTIRTIL